MTERDDVIADRIRRASELAEVAPESLREAAFRAAFDALSEEAVESAGSRPAGRRRVPASLKPKPLAVESASDRKQKSRRTSTRPGPKAALEQLVDEGFFSVPRTAGAARDQLVSARGRRYESKEIQTSLLRLLREGTLAREATDTGYVYSERR